MLDEIKELIANGKTDDAISNLFKNISSEKNELYNALIALNAEFVNTKHQLSVGILDVKEYRNIFNKINYALLSIIDSINGEDLDSFAKKKLIKDNQKNVIPFKMVFFGSNPNDTTRLNLDIESREVSNIIRRGEKRIKLIKEFAITYELFREIILIEKPNLIHLSGHSTGEEFIFHNAENYAVKVPFSKIASFLDLIRDSIEIIFLNAKISKNSINHFLRVVDYFAGTTELLSDKEAINYSSGFYTAIAYGKTYNEAIKFTNLNIDDMVNLKYQDLSIGKREESAKSKFKLYLKTAPNKMPPT